MSAKRTDLTLSTTSSLSLLASGTTSSAAFPLQIVLFFPCFGFCVIYTPRTYTQDTQLWVKCSSFHTRSHLHRKDKSTETKRQANEKSRIINLPHRTTINKDVCLCRIPSPPAAASSRSFLHIHKIQRTSAASLSICSAFAARFFSHLSTPFSLAIYYYFDL